MDVREQGAEAWIKTLMAPVDGAINTSLTAMAAVTMNAIAPYPTQPSPTRDNYWYQRGLGTKYRRKDGRVTVRKTSETAGRRWTIASRSQVLVALMNSASYSNLLHKAEDQTKRHAATGWKTDKEVTDTLEADGTFEELGRTAIGHAYKVEL